MQSPEGEFIITVEPAYAGQRLDKLACAYLSDCSRSFVTQLIQDGHITIAGQVRKPSYRVKSGETIQGRVPSREPPLLEPEPIPLEIIYEDADIIVINKPVNLVVHPGPGNASGTLVNGLLHHCPELGGNRASQRPGIVHRLDKDTTGAIVVAKKRQALDHLSLQFKHRTVRKSYLALVHGNVKQNSGTISLPIGRHPVDRKKMSTISNSGRDALTRWKVKQRYGLATLLELDLKTGRTHQIRVHCAAIHHPVIGDSVYASSKLKRPKHGDARLAAILASAPRQMLHASYLQLTHPVKEQRMVFEAPLADDMRVILNKLEAFVVNKDIGQGDG
jgi:23S rRNA pseudouridine1911/1915/1917 synthase